MRAQTSTPKPCLGAARSEKCLEQWPPSGKMGALETKGCQELSGLDLSYAMLATYGGQAPATGERAAALRDPSHSLWSRPAPDIYRIQLDTSKGKIILEITRALAPRGADRFYHLVETGFYDDSRFYRVIKGRFAQFGISGNPKIAAVWQNEHFPDDPVRASNVRGAFAYAMTAFRQSGRRHGRRRQPLL